MSDQRWLPLEANPEVMNSFVWGMNVPQDVEFCDIWGMDDDIVDLLPKPMYALLLLFPISEESERDKNQLEEHIKANGQYLAPDLIFSKQSIANACGTIALIHAVCNNADALGVTSGFFRSFIDQTASLSSDQRASFLETSTELEETHATASKEGQTKPPDEDEPVNLHFVAFIHKDNGLYEMDGRREFPINHGHTSPDSFVKDAIAVIRRNFVEKTTDLNFTLIGLTRRQQQ